MLVKLLNNMTHHSFYVFIYLQMVEIEKNLNGEDLNPYLHTPSCHYYKQNFVF